MEKDSGFMRPLVAFSPGAPQTVVLEEQEWKLVKTAHALTVSIELDGAAPANPGALHQSTEGGSNREANERYQTNGAQPGPNLNPLQPAFRM